MRKTYTLRIMRPEATGSEFVVHYHELWLKGKNRNFFRTRLVDNVRRALGDMEVLKIQSVAQRLVLSLGEGTDLGQVAERLRRVMGIAYFASVHRSSTKVESIRRQAWEVLARKKFSSFAVRAKTAGSKFPMKSMELERDLGAVILNHLSREGRGEVKVNLSSPEITCRVEIIPGGALIYTERIEGCGGLPAATGGRLLCLLSGGFDSAVAAYKMMRRGVHLSFVHFYGVPSRPGESSVPVATDIVSQLTHYQYSSKLLLIPFESIQREIMTNAPEKFRILLYRRMMFRIAQEALRSERALGLVTGDSVGQVASQTIQNLAAVDSAVKCTIYRPLSGDDKLDILETARRIGTYQISCEPFHDCCPRYMPRAPALHATTEELDYGEGALDIIGLVRSGLSVAGGIALKFDRGQVEKKPFFPRTPIECEVQSNQAKYTFEPNLKEKRSASP